ncbi:fimbrial protein [Rahnella sp. AN3-3W3]|uniref:fimbrial protein n=1 Tax=Rahnella sp. AN3-3W3 TaxID=1610578 RepID=UPI00130030B6|nr:fimbrial protein [Rahnella sp. AN3-3W3]
MNNASPLLMDSGFNLQTNDGENILKLNTFVKMSVLAAGMVAAMGANAEDTGNIQITGTLIASACQVDAASITAPVLLGDISSSTFSAVGDASAKEPFSIHITDCPEGLNNVMMVANGAKDATNEELVALDANSIATGVAVGIYNADDSLIKMGQTSAPVAISAENHDATINLKAAAVSTSDTITGGALSANTTFVLTYN